MKTASLSLFIVVVVLLSGCTSHTQEISKTGFQKIHRGMTSEEVMDLLGPPTDLPTPTDPDRKAFVYSLGKSHARIVFLNNKLISTEGDFQ